MMGEQSHHHRNYSSISKITINTSSLLLALNILHAFSFPSGSAAFVPSINTWKTPLDTPVPQQRKYRRYFTPTINRLSTLLTTPPPSFQPLSGIIRNDEPLNYDDDEYDDEDSRQIANLNQTPSTDPTDYSGCSSRQFSLGYDIQLTAYAGSLGFEEVTDWEYSNPETGQTVDPPPFDPDQPKRTREKSGSVVRIFRGELIGLCAAKARAAGLDTRVLLKEFTGEEALSLAKAEAEALAVVQSKVCRELDDGAKNGDWVSSASTRYVMGRVNGSTFEDDLNLLKWMQIVSGTSSSRSSSSVNSRNIPYTALLGELNLIEFLDNVNAMNEWYRALSVPPPKPGSLWLVYEYTGLTTLQTYSVPAIRRWSSLPPRKNIWGSLTPPPSLPPFRERSKYVVKGILAGSLRALATVHAAGLVHRSIGRSSIVISSVGQDKTEASSPLATVIPRLVVKLADFGFAGRISESSQLDDFRRRAKTFGLDVRKGSSLSERSIEAEAFAVAEDLHALGFVFVAVLLSSLAEVPDAEFVLPSTEEDSLQRLLSDIFEGDMDGFREYCEAEDVWTDVVSLLDGEDGGGVGWDVLESMCFAREQVAVNLSSGKILTAESLLSSPFFR